MYADKEEVLVPDIFWDYTSGKVLTMEWVDGVKLNEQDAIDRQGLKVLDLVNTGIQCSLSSYLSMDIFMQILILVISWQHLKGSLPFLILE